VFYQLFSIPVPNILQKSFGIINEKYIPFVSLKHLRLFWFGIYSLTFMRFESLNSNARLIIENRNTAQSKISRLVKKEKLTHSFHSIIKNLKLVTKDSVVIIDFSTFCGFQILTLALQTTMGRAVPLFFDIIIYPIRDVTSQNIFIIETIKKFKEIIGVNPTFVLDRGFAIPTLIEHFVKNQIFFYVRSKKGKHIILTDKHGKEEKIPIFKTDKVDRTIKSYGYILRLIVSNKSKKHDEPWYIITNNFDLKRKKIVDIYYFRFEIEETFKDLKHLYELDKFLIKKILTFKVLLWFVILGLIMAYFIEIAKEKLKENCKQKLSFVRSWFEGIQRSLFVSLINSYRTRQFY